MDMEYKWISLQQENCRQCRLLTWTSLIDQLVHPIEREKKGVNGLDGEIDVLASYKFHFISTVCGKILAIINPLT